MEVNIGTIGHPRMVIIGGQGRGLGRAFALALADSLCMHVEFESGENLDKIKGLEYDGAWLDELTCTDPYVDNKKSRGKGKKNKPWEHNFRG